MRYGWRPIVVFLVVAVAVCAGCRRGGEQKPGAAPPTGSPETTKPGPTAEPPRAPPQPPKVQPGDIAGKARVVFAFYLEKGPLTPDVTWKQSEGRLTISMVHSSVNMRPSGNVRIASENATAASVRSFLADFVKRTVEQLPEVKVLEAHVLFKGKDVGRLTASRQEMEKALAAADAKKGQLRGQRWFDIVVEKLPHAWVSPHLD